MPTLQVVSGETMRIVFMQINSQDGTPAPQLKDVRVRKAIIHAIDREAHGQEHRRRGLARAPHHLLPVAVRLHRRGRAALQVRSGARRRSCWPRPAFRTASSIDIVAYRERNQTEAMINNLQAVGIKAKLHFLQYAAMRESIRANKAQLTHQTWGSFSVNDVSASTPNYFAFEGEDITRDPEVRDLLLKGDNSVDPEARKKAYKKALTTDRRARLLGAAVVAAGVLRRRPRTSSSRPIRTRCRASGR